jgi:transposase-like protein
MKQTCIFCKSSSVVKNGIRKRKVRKKQSFLCRSCGKQFIEPDGFERMRYKRENVARAIHMHNDGFSLDQVRNHLLQHDGVRVTRQAIWLWHKKYAIFLKSDK